jgi:hypothetical protein
VQKRKKISLPFYNGVKSRCLNQDFQDNVKIKVSVKATFWGSFSLGVLVWAVGCEVTVSRAARGGGLVFGGRLGKNLCVYMLSQVLCFYIDFFGAIYYYLS